MHNELLYLALGRVADALAAGAESSSWIAAKRAIRLAAPDDPEMAESDAALAVELEDQGELARLVAGWRSGDLPLPMSDKAILKRAMKAFKKRLKLTRLDDESRLGGNPMTDGRASAISAVRPPEQYPSEVWDELLRQNRLRSAGSGLFESVD